MPGTYEPINIETVDQRADRKLEIHFANVGTSEEPEWEALGWGVEDMAMNYNHDVSTAVDVLGIAHADVTPAKPELDVDPHYIRGGQKLSAKLLDIERRNAISELSQFEILNVHVYLGAKEFMAELHKNCTIVPQSLGGSSYVNMPLNCHLSNDKALGKATIADGKPTFTPDVAA